MSFKRLEYERVWTDKDHFPTYEDSETTVREDLQYHPDVIKNFLNTVLIAALEAKAAAGTFGATDGDGAASTVQAVLDGHLAHLRQLDEDVETLASGGVPSVSRCTPVEFPSSEWTVIDGGYRLTVPQSVHRRTSGAFGYNLWENVSGTLESSTWNTAGTTARYEVQTGSIVFEAEEAYKGLVVFFGV